MAYHPDDMYGSDIDKLCGRNKNVKFGGKWDSEMDTPKRREPNQPRRVYQAPKYPDEPLHLGVVLFGFVGIIVICIVLYILGKG